MPQQQGGGYVSTDPNFGRPIAGGYVSDDPNYGRPAPPARREPPPPSAARRFLGAAAETLNPMNVVRGLVAASGPPTAHPTARIGNLVLNLAKGVIESHGDEAKQATGKATDAIAAALAGKGREALLSATEAGGHGLAAALPIVGPAAAHAGERIASGDVAGGLGEGAALAAMPAIARAPGAIGRGAQNVARRVARHAVPMTDDALALTGAATRPAQEAALVNAALEHRALPGVLRSGSERTAAAMRPLEATARAAIAPTSMAPVNTTKMFGHGPQAQNAYTRIAMRMAPADDLAAARKVATNRATHPRLQPEAGRAFELATGSMRPGVAIGQPGAGAAMERAMTIDTLSEVGRAVPGAEPTLASMRRLFPVAEAHANPTAGILPPGTLPTLRARIAAAAAHRLTGPAAQGLYDVGGSLANPTMEALIRANLLAMLMQQPER